MPMSEHTSSTYNYVRSRQLEGTYSADPTIGVWQITVGRVAYGWGQVLESVWPRVSAAEWPPEERPGADELAKALRILYYQRVRSLEDCKLAIERRYPNAPPDGVTQAAPVAAALEITEQWFNAPGGRIELPGPNDEIVGSHVVRVIGFNDEESQIQFVNSWGSGWGDKGFGCLPYSYFERCLVSAWIYFGAGLPDSPEGEYPHDINFVDMAFCSVLGKAIHVKQIYDAPNDERLGWAIAVERESCLDIEDFFVRPKYRGRGFGRQLCRMIDTLSANLSLPLRIWFSHADEAGDIQQRLCQSLGLTVVPSGVRWARYKAVCDPSSADTEESVARPARPRKWSPDPEWDIP